MAISSRSVMFCVLAAISPTSYCACTSAAPVAATDAGVDAGVGMTASAVVICGDGDSGDCSGGHTYREYLESLPEIAVAYGGPAVAVVAHSYGIPCGDVQAVHWVIGGIEDGHGIPVAGATIDCNSWIAWWGASVTSGASADGPAISYTSFAHEVAHCALQRLTGDPDPTHSRVAWWGTGGLVAQATGALITAGM